MVLVSLLTLGSAAGAIAGPYLLAGIETEKYERGIRYIIAVVMLFFGIIILTHSL
jgi:NADH:ubiquinone oxidoreductase subunit 6 (subunit J)